MNLSNYAVLIVSGLIFILTLILVIRLLYYRRSKFLAGYIFVATQNSLWSFFLISTGLREWMKWWLVGFNILFIISLAGLIYESNRISKNRFVTKGFADNKDDSQQNDPAN